MKDPLSDFERYIFLLDEMDLISSYYFELPKYKDHYIDIEYESRQKIYKNMYTEDYLEIQDLKKVLSRFTRIKARCLRWIRKLRKRM